MNIHLEGELANQFGKLYSAIKARKDTTSIISDLLNKGVSERAIDDVIKKINEELARDDAR